MNKSAYFLSPIWEGKALCLEEYPPSGDSRNSLVELKTSQNFQVIIAKTLKLFLGLRKQ